MTPVYSTEQMLTMEELKKHQDDCYKINIKPIMEELKNLSKSINDFKLEMVTTMAEMPDKILDRAETKFASKLTEKIVYGLVGIILLAVMGGILSIVILKSNSQQLTISDVQKLIQNNNR